MAPSLLHYRARSDYLMAMLTMPGTWWFRSRSDARWQGSGYCAHAMLAHVDVLRAIERLARELHADPPDDIDYGFTPEPTPGAPPPRDQRP